MHLSSWDPIPAHSRWSHSRSRATSLGRGAARVTFDVSGVTFIQRLWRFHWAAAARSAALAMGFRALGQRYQSALMSGEELESALPACRQRPLYSARAGRQHLPASAAKAAAHLRCRLPQRCWQFSCTACPACAETTCRHSLSSVPRGSVSAVCLRCCLHVSGQCRASKQACSCIQCATGNEEHTGQLSGHSSIQHL